jgi:A/G-specific adenine glycosylase
VFIRGPEFRRALLAWYRQHGRDLPWRHTRDPYAIVVSELMLQQTQVATVIPYYTAWLRRFPDFATLAAAPESDVLHAWQGLGYYARARNLHAAAKIVMTAHGGVFPSDVEAIRKLPGLGRYTANAVATFAFDQSVPILEANTARCLARLTNLQIRIDSSEGQAQLWELAGSIVPKRSAGMYNSALTDLGAMICISGQPRCGVCPVRSFCHAVEPATLPLKKTRTPVVRLIENHLFAVKDAKILLEQSSDRWRGMWILPRVNPTLNGEHAIHSARFPFTHHQITLQVFAGDPPELTTESQRYFTPDEIDSIPVPSPHRRALTQLLTRDHLNSSTSRRMTRKVQPCAR